MTNKTNIIHFFKFVISKFYSNYKTIDALVKQNLPKFPFKILSIENDEDNNYIIVVQVTHKQQIFRMRPEEILADDNLTDSFSQRDIRTLTYLGYLGINCPKYKILAKRHMDDNRILFAIQERGKETPIIKTANQISSDDNLLVGLHQKDAHMIGYISASEQLLQENNEKEKLLAQQN